MRYGDVTGRAIACMREQRDLLRELRQRGVAPDLDARITSADLESGVIISMDAQDGERDRDGFRR